MSPSVESAANIFTVKRDYMSIISVVHEFAALYSKRLLQKDKRWSDGRVKFYEFNNKIEVYSENNLMVCSDFYPHQSRNPLEHGIFADGNSYTLPGNQMVIEFSEYLGCSERDISNLFVKKEPQRVSAVKSEPRDHVGEIKREPQQMQFGLGMESSFSAVSVKQEWSPSLKLTTAPKSVSELVSRTKPRKRVGLSRSKNIQQKMAPRITTPTANERLAQLDLLLPKFKCRIPPGSNKTLQRLQLEAGSCTNYNKLVMFPPEAHGSSHDKDENWSLSENS